MKPLLILLCIMGSFAATANDSIFIRLNKLHFLPGDTLSFSCNIANYATLGLESATMNIWIEDVQRTSMWKYRYPMVNGILPKTRLAISHSLKPGTYAINFVIQKGLLSVWGRIRDNTQSTVNYFIITKDQQSHLNNLPVTKQGEFVIPNLVFDEEASLVFSPEKAKQDNRMFIDVITPLDSAFVPAAVLTQLITVGLQPHERNKDVGYAFNWEDTQEKGMLPHVTVTTKQKKTVQQFNDEYTSPFFRQDDAFARWFDGFEDRYLSGTANLANFLLSRVPNFERSMNFETHAFTHRLRGDLAIVYLNEMPVPPEFDINTISPTEIAVIKVINGPTMINRFGNGAAILIYTKRGNYYNDPNVKHNFVLKGYTPQVSNWN